MTLPDVLGWCASVGGKSLSSPERKKAGKGKNREHTSNGSSESEKIKIKN